MQISIAISLKYSNIIKKYLKEDSKIELRNHESMDFNINSFSQYLQIKRLQTVSFLNNLISIHVSIFTIVQYERSLLPFNS